MCVGTGVCSHRLTALGYAPEAEIRRPSEGRQCPLVRTFSTANQGPASQPQIRGGRSRRDASRPLKVMV